MSKVLEFYDCRIWNRILMRCVPHKWADLGSEVCHNLKTIQTLFLGYMNLSRLLISETKPTLASLSEKRILLEILSSSKNFSERSNHGCSETRSHKQLTQQDGAKRYPTVTRQRQLNFYPQRGTLEATAIPLAIGFRNMLPLPLPAMIDSLRYITHLLMELSVRLVIGRTWTLGSPM